MPISFQCSTCHSHLNLPDKYRGKRGKCPRCHGVIEIPHEGLDDVQDASVETIPSVNTDAVKRAVAEARSAPAPAPRARLAPRGNTQMASPISARLVAADEPSGEGFDESPQLHSETIDDDGFSLPVDDSDPPPLASDDEPLHAQGVSDAMPLSEDSEIDVDAAGIAAINDAVEAAADEFRPGNLDMPSDPKIKRYERSAKEHEVAAREHSADFPEAQGASKETWSNEFSDIPDPGGTPQPSDRAKAVPAPRRKTAPVQLAPAVSAVASPAAEPPGSDSAFSNLIAPAAATGKGATTGGGATASGVRRAKLRSTGMFTRTISADAPAASNISGTFEDLLLEDEQMVREYRFGAVGWFHKLEYVVGVSDRRVLARVASRYFFGLVGGGSVAYSEFPVAGRDCLEGSLSRPPVGLVALVALAGAAVSALVGYTVGVNEGVIGGLITAASCLLLISNFGKVSLSYGSLRVLVNARFMPFAVEVMKEIHRQRLAYRERHGVIALVDRPQIPRFDFASSDTRLRRAVWFLIAAAGLALAVAVMAWEPARTSAANWLNDTIVTVRAWAEKLIK